MPIFRFDNVDEYQKWLLKLATPERYVIVVTEDKEVVAQPIKASRPLMYGHMVIKNDANRLAFLKELEERGFDIFEVKDFSYDTERPPGTRVVSG